VTPALQAAVERGHGRRITVLHRTALSDGARARAHVHCLASDR